MTTKSRHGSKGARSLLALKKLTEAFGFGRNLPSFSWLVFAGDYFAKNTVLVSLLLIFSSTCDAKNLFVRPSASGSNSGADWNNAWSGWSSIQWGAISPGDTVWIAGGNYPGTLTISTSGVPGSVVSIMRATASDAAATSAAGWNSSFDSPIVCGGIVVAQSYITIDGRTSKNLGVGSFAGWTISYGDASYGLTTGSGPAALSNITLRFLTCVGPGRINQSGDCRGMSITPQGTLSNITLQYCETANSGDSGIYLTSGQNVDNALVEHCLFHGADCANPASFHPNSLFLGPWSNGTIRYNKIYEMSAEGLFFGFGPVSNVAIYGNVFFQGNTNVVPRQVGRGITFDDNADLISNVSIYNNTFVDLPLMPILFSAPSSGSRRYSNCKAENNIFWNCPNQSLGASGTSYNYNFDSGTGGAGPNGISNGSNPFVNYAYDNSSSDYRIVGTTGATYPRNKGINLGPPYNIDMFGIVDVVNGAIDIGAFQYGGGTAAPAPPSNLRVVQ